MGAKVTAALKTGNWDNSVIVNYNGGYSTNSISSPTYCVTQKVAAENMAACEHVDESIFVNYSLSYSGFKKTRINFYVGNLFNSDGPVRWRDGWAPTFRTFYVSGSYKF